MPFVDDSLFRLLNAGVANPFGDWLMPRITNLHQLPVFFVIVAAAALTLIVRYPAARRGVLAAVVAISMSDLLCARVVKGIWKRDRPCHTVGLNQTAFQDVRLAPGTKCPGSKSFPSNHASNMAALGTVLVLANTSKKRTKYLWLLLPLIIGYSRIYLGFHYPTDVLGGWLLGGAIGWVCSRLILQKVREESSVETN